MRRYLLTLTMFLALLSQLGSVSFRQSSDAVIEIINRSGQLTSQITDGDTIALHVKLPQRSAEPESITFTLGDRGTVVGKCSIPSGHDTCQTGVFPSLGWRWDADGIAQGSRVVNAYENGDSLIGRSESLEILARPVVMVHGFASSWGDWRSYLGLDGFLASIGVQGFALGDGLVDVDGAMNTGSLINLAQKTNTIAQNAAIMGEYIEGVKKETGAEMVDVVAYDMGGVISRYYIDRVMKERDTAQLIMLGSPMGGSDCSVLPAALGFYLPAAFELRPSYMQGIFNQQVLHRHGVEFYNLGGRRILDQFKSPCADVPNDTLVSLDSVNAVKLQADTTETIHTELTYSRSVFDAFVKPLLQKNAEAFKLSSDPDPVAVRSESLQFARLYTGHVETGSLKELNFTIDANVTAASFALFDETRSVKVSVTGPDGNVIPLDAEKNGFIQVDDPRSMIYLGFGFPDPMPGIWKVSVLASNGTPSAGADFAISAYFKGGAVLRTHSSALTPEVGEAIQLTAEMSLGDQLLEITEAKAILRDPNGGMETVDFEPGKQISTQWSPKVSGVHGVDIVVTGRGGDDAPVERTAFLAVDVQPKPDKTQIRMDLFLIVALVMLVLASMGFGVKWLIQKIARR